MKKFNFFNLHQKNYNKHVIKAFTLAEILIVMGIIGVVAEMTIPTVIQNFQEKQITTGLQKFNSTLQQAVMSWKNDIGCYSDAHTCIVDQNLTDNDVTTFNQIGKFMRISKWADGTSSDNSWLPIDTKNYYGIYTTTGWGRMVYNTANGIFMLQDGMIVSFDMSPDGFVLYVDVNGKKPPNRIGKDTFPFTIGFLSGKDIYYNDYYAGSASHNGAGLCAGAYTNCDPGNVDPTIGSGANPTSYVLLSGKLPDFATLSKTVSGFLP